MKLHITISACHFLHTLFHNGKVPTCVIQKKSVAAFRVRLTVLHFKPDHICMISCKVMQPVCILIQYTVKYFIGFLSFCCALLSYLIHFNLNEMCTINSYVVYFICENEIHQIGHYPKCTSPDLCNIPFKKEYLQVYGDDILMMYVSEC